MYLYEKEPLRFKEIFVNSWVIFLYTLRFTWLWALLNSLLFLTSDYFTLERITNLIHWKYFASLINFIIFIVLFFIPWSFLKTIMTAHMHFYAEGKKQPFMTSLIVTFKKFIPVTITSLIYEIIIFLGIFLFIIPGIYLGILFFMFLPLIILDNESMIQSFFKSTKLVLGSWWETFLLMLLPTSLVYVIREAIRRFYYNDFVMLLLSILLLCFIIPFSYALMLTQFNNLKIKYQLSKITTAIPKRLANYRP